MESMRQVNRRTVPITLAGACALALGAAGCGSSGSYKNAPRPPAPIVITAAIVPHQVSVSPRRFGAGPITLIVTNETNASQQLTLAATSSGFNGQTGPINPGDTASLKADLAQGNYTVKVQRDGIRPAKLTVGRERASAQNQLLQP
jgi:hypothetical protein